MSADLDWTRLETLVSRATERLRQAAADNQRLRAEVARLEAELERRGRRPAGAPRFRRPRQQVSPRNDEQTEEVRRRLAHLESEIESLLALSEPSQALLTSADPPASSRRLLERRRTPSGCGIWPHYPVL